MPMARQNLMQYGRRMTAFSGTVVNGVIVREGGIQLPEGVHAAFTAGVSRALTLDITRRARPIFKRR